MTEALAVSAGLNVFQAALLAYCAYRLLQNEKARDRAWDHIHALNRRVLELAARQSADKQMGPGDGREIERLLRTKDGTEARWTVSSTHPATPTGPQEG